MKPCWWKMENKYFQWGRFCAQCCIMLRWIIKSKLWFVIYNTQSCCVIAPSRISKLYLQFIKKKKENNSEFMRDIFQHL